jgi:hypothetical protein
MTFDFQWLNGLPGPALYARCQPFWHDPTALQTLVDLILRLKEEYCRRGRLHVASAAACLTCAALLAVSEPIQSALVALTATFVGFYFWSLRRQGRLDDILITIRARIWELREMMKLQAEGVPPDVIRELFGHTPPP